MIRNLLLVTSLCLCYVSPAYSQRAIVIDPSQVNITSVNDSKLQPKDLEVIDEILIKEKRVVGTIRNKENYSEFSFTVLSKVHAAIRLRFQDENIEIVEDYDLYEVKKLQSRNFHFIAYGKTEGNIEILNYNNEVIGVIPYKVVKESTFSKNVSLGASRGISDSNTRLNAGFNIRKRSNYSDEGSWSIRVSGSANTERLEDANVNVNVNYSW